MGVHLISATPAALTTANAMFRRRQPKIPVTSTAGRIHTQWCDHDTGETTNPNRATQMTASIGSPARSTRRIAHTVIASTSRHPATHSRKRSLLAKPEPGEGTRDVLVGVQRRGADPVGVVHRVSPVLQRVAPRQHETEQRRARERRQ